MRFLHLLQMLLHSGHVLRGKAKSFQPAAPMPVAVNSKGTHSVRKLATKILIFMRSLLHLAAVGAGQMTANPLSSVRTRSSERSWGRGSFHFGNRAIRERAEDGRQRRKFQDGKWAVLGERERKTASGL